MTVQLTVYQVLHVRIRAGPSPRPGNWILERSVDGKVYKPWQYFAVTSEECWSRYGLKPSFQPLIRHHHQPVCTHAFSKVTPVDSGEIHISLTQGWANASAHSPEVLKFTKARYLRLRLQRMSSMKLEKTRHSHGSEIARKFYYTIKDILIQGRCNCNGHASKCRYHHFAKEAVCECAHKTTGTSCDRCLPMYNQREWRPGTPKEANPCVKCECHGHATECRFDPEVEDAYLSMDANGQYIGGGVCINCSEHTAGINCETCEDGWYREAGVLPNASVPCKHCDCHLLGSIGVCYKDDSEASQGKPAGGCICREGYTGLKCDRCSPGYRGFPHCTPCPCDPREGKYCERCKPGYFFLDRDNTVECTECYCSAVTKQCDRAEGYSINEFMSMDGWQVSDLMASYIVQPYTPDPNSNVISVADYQMAGVESYFWMAPPPYRGNKLTSYGSRITFTVSWDVMRGDTSGKATTGPDVVLIGHNGLRIGHGNVWHKEKNMNITVQFLEDGWYHVLDGVRDIVTRLRRNQANWEEYRGDDITRAQFMSVLANIKHLLLRAKFHTDQAEGSLDSCIMEIGYESGAGSSIGFLEKCTCPPGYVGLSCETCDFGYTKYTSDGSSRQHSVCSKCNCHGHAATCDPSTFQCGKCEHNTTGALCERCIDGFYGDATIGTPNDCRKCACPLIDAKNNFSPLCEADNLGYVCTKCPVGYTGRHCERCAAGYFGNPEEPGSFCQPCNCKDGPCDHLTGRCLTCHGNTYGLRCELCKPNHFGTPSTTGCFPCECSEIGSFGEECDVNSGQCKCKDKFQGRSCDRCQTGLGNVTAGCIPCDCNTLGVRSSLCDALTGACACHLGVEGDYCDRCLPQHYGYSDIGCSKCNCHSVGSEGPYCDLINGDCACRNHVIGRTCNLCQAGYWGLSENGCAACQCDTLGSRDETCDPDTGQCYCKPGVGGLKCDRCLPRFYNMSSQGCSECDVCDLPGRICDPDTGACVCPPLTTGATCEICQPRAWGFMYLKGCKPCDCDPNGSIGGMCDPHTGLCACREGYEGNKCQSCSRGYYGYPSCRKCGCELAGTQPQHCHGNVCVCDPTGQCPCKLAMPGHNGVIKKNGKQLNITNNLRIIPSVDGDVELGVSYLFDTPVYWQLPVQFLGDKILSYGGYLRFSVETEGETTLFPQGILATYPLIQIQGNDKIVLEHFPDLLANPTGQQHVRLHESSWRKKNYPKDSVNRETLMIALQNIQHILIRASDSADFTRARLRDVALDTAVTPHSHNVPTAKGIELCECPSGYNATSCQNPTLGFFRHRSPTVSSTIIIQLIGEAVPCECNDRSTICDIETGHCTDCIDNTGGPKCDLCAEGYYGNPMNSEECLPCPCPTTGRNFATTCQVFPDRDPICVCKKGYRGHRCEKCDYGWYGYPESGGICKPCKCNAFGSEIEECDEQTGQCNCKPGVTGWDCSRCIDRMFVLSEKGCTECTDSCTRYLLEKIGNISSHLHDQTNTILGGVIAPPREPLMKMKQRLSQLEHLWMRNRNNFYKFEEMSNNVEKDLIVKQKQLHNKLKKLIKLYKPNDTLDSALQLKRSSDNLHNEVESTKGEIEAAINRLKSYAAGEDNEKISISAMLLEAKLILGKIRDTDLETKIVESENILRCCNNSINELKYIGDRHEIVLLSKRLSVLLEKNDFFNESIKDTFGRVDEVDRLNEENRNKIQLLRMKIKDIEKLELDAKQCLNTTHYAKEIAKVYIGESEDNLEGLISMKKVLYTGIRDIEARSNVIRHLNERYKQEYVIPAQQHADDLMNTTERYINLFKTDAGIAMKASKAYQEINDALKSAQEAVNNATIAADIAFEQAYPGEGSDSLLDKASASKERSFELQRRANDQLERVGHLLPELNSLADSIEKSQNDVVKLREEVDTTNNQLKDLKLQSGKAKQSSIETVMTCDKLIEMSEEVQDDIVSLSHNITKKLQPWITQLEVDSELSLSTARELIDESQANSKKAQDIVDRMTFSLNKQAKKFSEWNDTIANKLELLRNKITQAHHIANGIRISMTSIGENGGSCVRTYQPPHLEPSTMTSIILTYAISSQLRDALLFYLPSSATEDFVAIEMVNRKMRFVWNVGAGIGEVTHPLHIQTAGDLSKDQHWYRVEAERVSNIGQLWVRPVVVPEGSSMANTPPAVNSSTPGAGRLDVGKGDRVWVGGADRRHPHLKSTQSGLVGCLHQLYLNGRPIGLWDFSTQNPNSCTACVEGAEEVKDESFYGFSGDGYAVLSRDSSGTYNKYIFSVSLSFRTFDSNAVLLLVVGIDKRKYISLVLKDGRLVFRIGYGGDATLEISTLEKYNNGSWNRVEASRYFDRKKKLEKENAMLGVLKVGKEVRDGAPTPPPNQETIPDLSMAKYYIGGLPPGVGLMHSLPGPFLGCMSEILIDQAGYSLLKGTYWGVQASCSLKPITVAGFHGEGFIELPSHNLKKKDSFGFVFQTTQRDVLLMLSTFEGLDRLSYYSVSLRRGQLDVRLNAGRGEVRLASISSEYADSKFHSVVVTKIGRRLELRVDDTLDAATTLPEGATTIKAPGESGGLYFGGLPPGFNTTGRTFSNQPLVGTIKDIIFNDKIFGFDKPIQFEDVTIGRFGPINVITDRNGGNSRGASGCRKVPSYTLEAGAVKFGDFKNSHVQVNFRKRATFQKNFTLQLDFRTFYPEGLLFIIPGARRPSHYLMGALKNGRLQVVFKGRKKIELAPQAVCNDGIWHKILLEKHDRKMILKVDALDPEKTKTPKKVNIGSALFLGGLPDKGANLPPALLQRIQGFKGCIRNLKLNNHEEHIVGEKSTPFKVGQCFPQVERGSYFPGDAYAIYKNKFNVGSLIELELEFRTSEMNGVFLSVSEPQGYPALSLELQNGKVVMNGDMGDRRPFQVIQGFATDYSACDNRWHRIQVTYIKDELTLKVDNLEQSYWLSDNGHLTQASTNSPLYIGGLPERAPSGTLESRENFRGCIRNVIINGERRDWVAMADLHNILLSSCPLDILEENKISLMQHIIELFYAKMEVTLAPPDIDDDF
uniref:Laminin subunit alpha-2 n=1 Tax=Rhodnius prolixus TaxID=13249 RepID=T1HX12_RHOPR